MKKWFLNFFPVFIVILTISGLIFLCAESYAQTPQSLVRKKTTITADFSEAELKKSMKADGLTDPEIDKLLEERRLFFKKYKTATITTSSSIKKKQPPYPGLLSCSDLGVENGWNLWQGAEGTNTNGNPGILNPPVANPSAPRFNITSGNGIDPCTPGTVTGSGTPGIPGPPIPVVAPGFGNSSIQIGQQQTDGCMIEQLTFPFTPTLADVDFVYTYAAVLHDPTSGHGPTEKPYIEFKILDANGDTVPCSYQRYVSDPNLPGWYTSNTACVGSPDTYYKPWTVVGVDLSAYVGQPLTFVIDNHDCIFCGHYAHSYWDFQCGPVPLTAGCIGNQSSITGPASNPANPYSYQWYQNGNLLPGEINQIYVTTPAAGDTFSVYVSQPSGCNFVLTYTPVVVVADFNFTDLCGDFVFTDSSYSVPSGSAVSNSWAWTFPGGSPATANTSTVAVSYPIGSYTASLTITSSAGCTASVATPIVVGPIPTIAFSSNIPCLGEATSLTDGSVAVAGDPFVSWNWSMPGGTPATSGSQNTSTMYGIAGTHSVTLSVTTQSGCVKADTATVTVNPDPVAAFSAANVCVNSPTVFNDLSTGTPVQWDWNFGDGTTSTQQNTSHTYSASGTYSATLVVTNSFGCKDTQLLTTIVDPFPAALFSSLPVCVGDPTCFTDGSTITPGTVNGWTWNFGDPASGAANTSTLQNPCHTFSGSGQYTVTLVATSANGCRDTISLPANVNPLPTAVFSPTTPCLGFATSLTDGSVSAPGDPITSWNWIMPGGTPVTSASQNTFTTYGAAGTYTASLIVTSVLGCKDTVDQPVIVNPLPVAAFSAGPVCFNNPTLFADQSAGAAPLTYTWDFGDSNTSTQQNPSHTYATAGTFSVTEIVTNGFGCTDTALLNVVVNPLPVALFNSLPVCLGDSTCFTDASTVIPGIVNGWTWNFGDPPSGSANTSTLQNPCHIFTGSGLFSVMLTATSDSGCQSTATLPANVTPLPTAAFVSTIPCLGSSTILTDSSASAPGDPIASWYWNMPGGTPATAPTQNSSTTYGTSGTHTLSLIVTSVLGCIDTVDQPVVIYNPPSADFGSPMSGCSPVCNNYADSSISIDGAITNWRWTFPGGNPSASTSPNPQNICYYTPGSYSVSLIVTTSHGCSDTIDLPMVEVYDDPMADFCVTPAVAPTTTPIFNFCDMWSSDVVQWTWNFGDNDSDVVNTDPVHSYAASATQNDFYQYNICVKVWNQYGCWDDTCKPVELLPEFTFFIPNTFTPNEDHINDFFYGKSRGVKEYSIWLFDRWGNEIWNCHREDKNTNWDSDIVPVQEGLSSACQWDGVVVNGGVDMSGNSGKFAQEDVYVWKVRLKDIFNKSHDYIGHVTIVK